MLRGFLEHTYSTLTDEEKGLFEALLNEQDTQLIAWLIGNAEKPEGKLGQIVERIRNTTHAAT